MIIKCLYQKTICRSQAVLATGFPVNSNFDNKTISGYIDDFSEFKKIRMFGSASLSLAYTAAGIVDVYKENAIMLWDVAAGAAIVEASGGLIKYKFTNKNNYTVNIMASNGMDV